MAGERKLPAVGKVISGNARLFLVEQQYLL